MYLILIWEICNFKASCEKIKLILKYLISYKSFIRNKTIMGPGYLLASTHLVLQLWMKNVESGKHYQITLVKMEPSATW